MIFINKYLKYLALLFFCQFFILTCIFAANTTHPCINVKKTETIDQKNDDMFYDFYSQNKKSIKAFKSNIEYSYLYDQLIPIMQITREIVNNDYYIKIHNNPRYYFLKGIEDLMNKNNKSTNKFLTQFINFYDSYFRGNQSIKAGYFQRGCSNDDVDWIENNHKISIEYKLSAILVDYLNSLITLDSAIKSIDNLDFTPNTFDLNDNIIFILMNNGNYSIDDYRFFFNKSNKLKINKLIYDDNLDYYLSSQIAALSMFNFFEAEKKIKLVKGSSKGLEGTYLSKKQGDSYLKEVNRKFSNINKYNNIYLFPLMYYFEMKLIIFDIYDTGTYSLISEIFSEIKKSKKEYFDPNYTSWLNLYANKDTYHQFDAKLSNFKEKLALNKGNHNIDNIHLDFNRLVLNKESNIDSIYFSKTMQCLNDRNFFFDISKVDDNTYWIPEIEKDLKDAFHEIEQSSKRSFVFSDKKYPITKKINQSSFLFYWFYDYYINNEAQQSIKNTIEVSPGSKQETGIYPLIDSINGHLKSILNP